MKLSALKNLGKTMEKKLISVGIHDADDLAGLGSHGAFVRLKAAYPEVCVVHLYALHAALEGVPLAELTAPVRRELQDFYRNSVQDTL